MSNQERDSAAKRDQNAPGALDPTIAMGLYMSIRPSVGRFKNKEVVSLYTKGSSAQFNSSSARTTMAPYSNHGLLWQQSSQQPSPHPSPGIVDLRTAFSAEGKTFGPHKIGYSEEMEVVTGHHQAATVSNTYILHHIRI